MRWPLSRLSPDRLSPGAAGWLAVLASGVLWGGAIAAIEALREPPVDLPPAQFARFLAAMMATWMLAGLCWAVTTRLAGERLSARRMVLLWLVGSFLLSAVMAALSIRHTVLSISMGMWALFGRDVPFDAMYAHNLWLNAVFGGLYVAGYWAFLRAARSRRRLAQVQLALSDEAALLQEARLAALRSALQPSMLIASVRALRDRYEIDPAAADALLDQLVAYLRAATGGPARASSARVAEAYQTLSQAMGDPAITAANTP
jgi:hypothetical protein